MVTVVIAATILVLTGVDTFDLWQSFPATRVALPVLGGVLICLGLVLMVATIRLFVTVGKGTLAPWNPTQRLVAQGVYRHVRNPMISGVFFVLLGEAALAASLPLLGWFIVFVVANLVYIPLVEEPGLVRRFGDDYLAYRQNVPRWIPRVRPWVGEVERCVVLPRSVPTALATLMSPLSLAAFALISARRLTQRHSTARWGGSTG
jgi:protein-S-isoprenylcysteine O-methyltransferase Ste14